MGGGYDMCIYSYSGLVFRFNFRARNSIFFSIGQQVNLHPFKLKVRKRGLNFVGRALVGNKQDYIGRTLMPTARKNCYVFPLSMAKLQIPWCISCFQFRFCIFSEKVWQSYALCITPFRHGWFVSRYHQSIASFPKTFSYGSDLLSSQPCSKYSTFYLFYTRPSLYIMLRYFQFNQLMVKILYNS